MPNPETYPLPPPPYLSPTPPPLVPTQPALNYVRSREDLAAILTEFMAEIPRAQSEGYRVPSTSEAESLANLASLLSENNLSVAEGGARALGYEVRALDDLGTGLALNLLREVRGSLARPSKAWGLYALNPSPYLDVLVEAPHPLADLESERIALELFRRLKARALLVAGAHRRANADESADVAHRPESVFEAVHRRLLRANAVVIQIHGFSEENHPELGDIVISSGSPSPDSLMLTLNEQLRGAGFKVCLYDGTRCRELAATLNSQGASARSAGARFVHLELSRALRQNPNLRDTLLRVVAQVLGARGET